MKNRKVWIEINKAAAEHNIKTVRSVMDTKTKLWAVVKSNAYGHGLTLFSDVIKDRVDGFCVDSVIEGIKLREAGIKKDILVLGPTLFSDSLRDAEKNTITVTISTFEALRELSKLKNKPSFHIKVDTGMHRQGFYLADIQKTVTYIKTKKLPLIGIYTHFASSKDLNYPTFTDFQFHAFKKAVVLFSRAGFKKLIKHTAATGGVFINKEYHLDAVRVGIGLYGYWPSKELELQLPKQKLNPVLSWKTKISEVKDIEKGSYIGYDLVERVSQKSKMAVIPIGYWHGFDRKLSKIGEILVAGKRARVLGRVSMDLIVIDVTGINCRVGDTAVILGTQRKDAVTGEELGHKIETTHYEVITRINPLIERVVT